VRGRARAARAGVVWAALAACGCACTHPPAPIPGGPGQVGAVFQDPSRSVDERVADLLARMTLDEKVAQLMTDAPAIPRLGVPAYDWWNEALHGVARAGIATVFPQAIGLGATFDEALMLKVATATSDEARAKHHEALRRGQHGRYQGLTFFSPNVNIFRDPRWGRGQETYGEDPLLTARLAVAFVRGMQGDDPRYLKTAATAKHLAVHSGPEALRHSFDARVSAHDLFDTYLPQFEAAVREGHVASVMAAYNRVNGDPCVASPTLLGGILRGRWGFSGYVVGDCGAVADVLNHHHVAPTLEQAAVRALEAGTDLDCGGTYTRLAGAATNGRASVTAGVRQAIDQALGRLFAVRFRLGMFDPPERVPWAHTPMSVVDAPEHRALARRAAVESLVLLENRGGVLPLGSGVRRLAVVGPAADDREVLLGNYHGEPSRAVTLLEGLRARARARGVEVTYARGASYACGGGSSAQLAEALRAARGADAVVAALGLSPRWENEAEFTAENPSGDRRDLGLPGGQEHLLRALVATGKPVVLVLAGGGAFAIPWAAEHVQAIVQAWYPGEEGGSALADVLFGEASPSGRLPVTVYRSADDLPPFTDYAMRGRTYRYLSRPPLYPFGHGLSYTSFRYTNLAVAPDTVTVDVENTGARAGDEVVQVYLLPRAPPAYAPRRWLAAFARIALAPSERRAVRLALPPSALAIVDEAGRRIVGPGTFDVAVGGGQPGADGHYASPAQGVTGVVTLSGPAFEVSSREGG
jgi:beta-glucosidase